MDKTWAVEATIEINAAPAAVWDAIVDPEKVKQYFFGTNIASDWQPGSAITFSGEFQGQQYVDKGIIKAIIPEMLLQYDYWSGFSGLEDKPENYSLVTYTLEATGTGTRLTIGQQGFPNEDAKKHGEGGWAQVLQGLKQVVEAS